MKKDIRKLARKLFNPYAEELKFDKRDWNVFLRRLSEIERVAVENYIDKTIDDMISHLRSQLKHKD
jgi:hypothetical protein